MKFQKTSLLALLALSTVAIAVTATPTFSQSTSNKNISFRCNEDSNPPTIVAYNPQNEKNGKTLPLIHWKSEYIDSADISKSCKDAADKIEKHYEKNENKFFSTLHRNSENQFVFCLVNKRGEDCEVNDDKILFRISQKINNQELKKVLPTIINPNFANVQIPDEIRGRNRIYTRSEPKKWKLFFGLI